MLKWSHIYFHNIEVAGAQFIAFIMEKTEIQRKRQIMRRGQKQRRCLISGVVCDTFPGVPLPTAEVHPAQ